MEPRDVLTKARETMDARMVFGQPVTQDDLVIIPAARISGGAGGGGRDAAGEGPAGEGGAGFGVRSTPAGAFVIRDGEVSWRPALDVNKIILGGQVVAVVALLVTRSIIRAVLARRAAGD